MRICWQPPATTSAAATSTVASKPALSAVSRAAASSAIPAAAPAVPTMAGAGIPTTVTLCATTVPRAASGTTGSWRRGTQSIRSTA